MFEIIGYYTEDATKWFAQSSTVVNSFSTLPAARKELERCRNSETLAKIYDSFIIRKKNTWEVWF